MAERVSRTYRGYCIVEASAEAEGSGRQAL
jgi:hypothetical protein